MVLSLGIVVAQAINIGTQHLSYGWRISLACAGAPAIVLTIGGLVLPDTPNSLIERGKFEVCIILAQDIGAVIIAMLMRKGQAPSLLARGTHDWQGVLSAALIWF